MTEIAHDASRFLSQEPSPSARFDDRESTLTVPATNETAGSIPKAGIAPDAADHDADRPPSADAQLRSVTYKEGDEVRFRRRPRHVSVNLGQDAADMQRKLRAKPVLYCLTHFSLKCVVVVTGAGEHDQAPHRVILVPPRLTDSQLKALLHAWCSHDAAIGYMIVLNTSLPGVRSTK